MKKGKAPKLSYMNAIMEAIEKEDAKQTHIAVSLGVGHYIEDILSRLSNTPARDMPLILTALEHLVKVLAEQDPEAADLAQTIKKMVIYPEVDVIQYKMNGGNENDGNAK